MKTLEDYKTAADFAEVARRNRLLTLNMVKNKLLMTAQKGKNECVFKSSECEGLSSTMVQRLVDMGFIVTKTSGPLAPAEYTVIFSDGKED